MMISKKMGLSRLLPMLAIGGMFVFSGCDDSKDLYNPDRIQEEAKEAFPVKNIDPNQTWETSAVCNASVSVKETAGETYTIKVYTANPYNTNGDAALLAKTTVENGKTVNFKFDIPAALQYVYVMKVNGEGYSSAVPAAVENGTVKVAFGEGSGTTRAAMTRAGGSFFTPEVPGEEYFPKQAPEDCKTETSETHKGGGNFLLKDRTYEYLRIENGGNFYIQGQVTLKDWNEPGNIANFYLLPGATLKLEMKQFNHRFNSILSIGEGAKLVANTLKGEKGSKYLNRGAIKADNIEVTDAYVYNANTLETEDMLLTNDNSKVCNASDAKMKISEELKIQGNGHFINETDGVVIADETILDCSYGSWENAGHFTTSEMEISAWNNNVKNSCWLTVKDEFTISDGGIFNESYINCEDLYLNNATIHMAEKSFFEVTDEAKFGYNPYPKSGFIAPTTGERALLKMEKAIRQKGNNNIAYSGNLYIACNDHFDIQKDQWNIYYECKNGAQITGADNANITIPSSECNPGYNSIPDEDDDNDEELQTYTYAFEDMMKDVGDYDFNDVVLYVTVPYEKDGKKFIDVTLKAAGASKQLAVLFNKQTIFGNVHEALGVPVGTIVNTGEATGTTKTETIEVGSNFSLTNDGDFYISDGKREIHIPNFTNGFNKGDVPYAIRIASSWKWPKERVLITEAYTGFATWAQDATSEPNWYNNSEGGKVMN